MLPIVIPTVPVVEPPVPMATVFVVKAPGVPLAMLTVLPLAVVDVPPAIFTVWVVEVMLPLAKLNVYVPAVAALDKMLIVEVPVVSEFWIFIIWPFPAGLDAPTVEALPIVMEPGPPASSPPS